MKSSYQNGDRQQSPYPHRHHHQQDWCSRVNNGKLFRKCTVLSALKYAILSLYMLRSIQVQLSLPIYCKNKMARLPCTTKTCLWLHEMVVNLPFFFFSTQSFLPCTYLLIFSVVSVILFVYLLYLTLSGKDHDFTRCFKIILMGPSCVFELGLNFLLYYAVISSCVEQLKVSHPAPFTIASLLFTIALMLFYAVLIVVHGFTICYILDPSPVYDPFLASPGIVVQEKKHHAYSPMELARGHFERSATPLFARQSVRRREFLDETQPEEGYERIDHIAAEREAISRMGSAGSMSVLNNNLYGWNAPTTFLQRPATTKRASFATRSLASADVLEERFQHQNTSENAKAGYVNDSKDARLAKQVRAPVAPTRKSTADYTEDSYLKVI